MVAGKQQTAGAGRGGGVKRSTLAIAGGLSLVVHLGLVASLAGLRPTTIAQAPLDDAVTLVALDVEPDPEAAPPDPEAAPPAPEAADVPAPPAPVIAADKKPARPRRAAAPAPAEPSPAVVAEGPDEAISPPPLEGLLASASGPSGATANTSLAAEVEPLPPRLPVAPVPPSPALVGAGVARNLRLYDEFPSLPERLRTGNFHRSMLANVCVSEHGQVSGVRIDSAGVAPLEDALRHSIRSWRYRPLLVGGRAIPFCHDIRIDYREG